MIGMHLEKHKAKVAYGWLNPFLPNSKMWHPKQTSVLPHTLKAVSAVMNKFVHSPTTAFKNNHRCDENFIEAFYLELDFDYGRDLDWAIEWVMDRNLAAIVAQTKSHRVEKVDDKGNVHPPCDRFRILIRLTDIITDVEVYKATAEKYIKLLGADPKCKDPRFFFPSPVINYIGPDDGETISPIPAPPKRIFTPRPYENSAGEFMTKAIRAFREFGHIDGGRNDHVYKAACDYFKLGHFSFEAVYSAMRNRSPLDEKEFLATLQSAFKRRGAA